MLPRDRVGGVLAFGVSQRLHELGIRAALGADRWRLLRMVVAEGGSLTAAGLEPHLFRVKAGPLFACSPAGGHRRVRRLFVDAPAECVRVAPAV